MIILLVILAIIAIAGFIVTTALRKGLDPKDDYNGERVEAEAAILAAEGEARALEITREALENMPDTWIAQQYLEKWDGKLPQFITDDGTSVMLTPDLE